MLDRLDCDISQRSASPASLLPIPAAWLAPMYQSIGRAHVRGLRGRTRQGGRVREHRPKGQQVPAAQT